MKYGVIGTGWIAASFIAAADSVGGMELVAVYSRSYERGARFLQETEHTAAVVTDLNGLAESEAEGVYIASPNRLHYAQSRFLLEHGKHVLCEKPATVEPEEAEELILLAKDRGLVYMEAMMMLYLPQRAMLKDAIRGLGKVYSARIDFSQLSSKYPAYLRGETPNIFNPRLATGALMDLGVYGVYAILDWFGLPADIKASASFLRTGADHSGAAVLTYPDALVTLTYSKTGQDRIGSEILGDKGTLRIGLVSQMTKILRIGLDGEETLLFDEKGKTWSMAGEAEAFRRHVEEGSFPPEEDQRLMVEVSRILHRIREEAGIHFPKEDPA